LTIISFINGGFKGAKPLVIKIPLSLEGEGAKRVPRKIKDFSGCLKGVRVI